MERDQILQEWQPLPLPGPKEIRRQLQAEIAERIPAAAEAAIGARIT